MLSSKYHKKVTSIVDIVLLTIAFIFVYCIIFKMKWIITLDGDNAPQTYAIYSVVGKALHNGELPLWNPYIWGGLSNIGAPITEAFYPINWILCYCFYDVNTELVSYAIIPWNLTIHIALYVVGMYALLKKIGVYSLWAIVLSLLSVCCYGFSSYYVWIVYFDGFSWMPLLTLAALSLIEAKTRKTTYLGVISLGCLFALEASVSVSLMLTISAFFVLFLFVIKAIHDKENWKRYFIRIIVAGCVGIMLAAPVILSTIHYLLFSARFVDGNFIYGLQKVPWNSFVANKVSFSDAENLLSVTPVSSWLSFGGVLLTLCILGIFNKGEKYIFLQRWSIVGISFALLYCFGYIVTDFFYYVPFLNNLRETYMYGCIVGFMMTVLAGFGVKRICNNEKKKEKNYKKIEFILTEICLIYNLLPHKSDSIYKEAICIALILAVLFWRFNFGYKITQFLYLFASFLCVVVYLITFNSCSLNEIEAIQQVEYVNAYNKDKFDEDFLDKTARIMYIGILPYPSNQGATLGFMEDLSYFNPSTEVAIKTHLNMDYVKRSQLHNIQYWIFSDEYENNFINMWGVNYLNIIRSGKKIEILPSWTETESRECLVYKTDTLGNAWVISKIKMFDNNDDESVFAWINDPSTRLNEIASVDCSKLSEKEIEKLNFSDCQNGSYNIIVDEYRNNSITYHVTSQKEGVLVTSEIYDSDWKVYVNNRRETLLKVDYSNRGVIIPTGESIVKFVYFPNEFLIGVFLQLLAIIGGAAWGMYLHLGKWKGTEKKI